MPGFLAAVPRFGVKPTLKRALEFLLHAEMYLVDTIVYFSAGKHAAVPRFAHLRELRMQKREGSSFAPFSVLHQGPSFDNLTRGRPQASPIVTNELPLQATLATIRTTKKVRRLAGILGES
jgi:hypothetical protein